MGFKRHEDRAAKAAIPLMVRPVPTARAAALPAAIFLAFAFTLPAVAADSAAPPSSAQPKLPVIVVTEAVTRPMTDRVIATGTIKPVDEVDIQPLVDGLSVRAINADVSTQVREGDVLATLNDDSLVLQKSELQANKAKAEAAVAQYQAQVLEAQANLDDAKRQRDRTVKLSQSGTSTASQVEQANAQVEVAEARLNAARQAVSVGQADSKVVAAQIETVDLNLARTSVRSPVGGVVSAKNARVGQIASGSGTPLFTVIRNGEIELVADLSETDIQKVKAGQTAVVRVAGSNATVDGRVRIVSPDVDPVTRLGQVHIIIDGKGIARAGMYARADIVIQQADALALPLSAVTVHAEKAVTRKVDDGVVRQVAITTGFQDGGFVQILAGLKAGDVVVAKAGAFVRDGDHVAPVKAAPDQAEQAADSPAPGN